MCSEAAIQISHVTSSSPSTFANPSPAPGSRPKTSAASGAASRPTTSITRKSPSAASIAAGEGTLDANVALRPPRLAAAAHRGLHARRPRPHRLLRLRAQEHRDRAAGRRRGGPRRGRDLRAGRPRRPAAGRSGARARPASSRSTPSPSTSAALDTFPGYTPEQDVYRRYRRWAFESAALDLALRQADTSLHELLGRTAEPVTFVVSSRMGEPPTIDPVDAPAGPSTPTLRFKLDATPDWTEELIEQLQATRRGRLDRLQGRLQGHASSTSRPTRTSTAGSPRPSPTPGSRTRTSRPTRRAARSPPTRTGSPGTRRSTTSRTSSPPR